MSCNLSGGSKMNMMGSNAVVLAFVLFAGLVMVTIVYKSWNDYSRGSSSCAATADYVKAVCALGAPDSNAPQVIKDFFNNNCGKKDTFKNNRRK